ncbi:MAG: energy-coupling factor transporter transmembrane protein EcfT [Firmicutes bacterium]|nr:energy-coupling factor transporter transmembrane protein EcfT [Bacillota bacterium]
MIKALHSDDPIHPIAAFLCTFAALIVGMICSKSPYIYGYIIALAVLFSIQISFWAVFLITLTMSVLGIIFGGVSVIISGNYDTFYITAARFLILGICSVPLLSIPPADLARAMNQLKVPRSLTLGMLITIRFIPILFGEIFQIRDAMRSRGVNVWFYTPKMFYRAFLVPLIMRCVNISDILSLSVETRAFDTESKEASVYKPINFKIRDMIFIMTVIAVAAVMMGVRILL